MHFKRLLAALLAAAMVWCTSCACAASYNMPYYIDVDVTNQIVTIYNTSDHTIARQMLCSSGMNDCTPNGTFYLVEKGRASERGEWTWFEQYECWVKFATRIYKGYMFHSLPFSEKNESTMTQKSIQEFGMPTSHGCIRLRVDDARFIAKQCLRGTRVDIHKSDTKENELRELLRISSYTGEDGMTYPEFLGYSENALSRGSTGTAVTDLQHRLIDLGYFEGEVTGSYGMETIAAVKHVQQDLGLAENGISSEELLEVLYSDEAPVSAGQATLEEGRSGPVVKKLQSALSAIGLYSGEIDSVYDVEVSNAVRAFQSACGYTIDGIATAEIQQALYHQLDKLEETFGAGSIPACEQVTEEITMAKLDFSSANIIIRSQPDTESQNLGKLYDGDSMMVGEVNGDWANISAGGVTGYVKTKYLKPYSEYNYILKYNGADGASYQIGHTMEEYKAGAKRFADEFSAYYASEQFASSAEETVDYVTVNTGTEGVNLNLRASADASGEILAEVPNGTNLRVLARESGWTKVGFDDKIGYLLDDYLTLWQGSADEVESTEQEDEMAYTMDLEAGTSILAMTVCADDDGMIDVYKSIEDEPVIGGEIKEGVQVEVVNLNAGDGWVHIRYKEKEGYIEDDFLQFQLIE